MGFSRTAAERLLPWTPIPKPSTATHHARYFASFEAQKEGMIFFYFVCYTTLTFEPYPRKPKPRTLQSGPVFRDFRHADSGDDSL